MGGVAAVEMCFGIEVGNLLRQNLSKSKFTGNKRQYKLQYMIVKAKGFQITSVILLITIVYQVKLAEIQ